MWFPIVYSSIPIDYNLYRKFWALQDYFRKPVQCFDKAAWKTFSNVSSRIIAIVITPCLQFNSVMFLHVIKFSMHGLLFQYSEEVLSCFENFKLDDVKCKANSMFTDADAFFAKYLTSEKVSVEGWKSWQLVLFIHAYFTVVSFRQWGIGKTLKTLRKIYTFTTSYLKVSATVD